jgi:3-oxoacyl-[acyl-carrier-protein] synthase III
MQDDYEYLEKERDVLRDAHGYAKQFNEVMTRGHHRQGQTQTVQNHYHTDSKAKAKQSQPRNTSKLPPLQNEQSFSPYLKKNQPLTSQPRHHQVEESDSEYESSAYTYATEEEESKKKSKTPTGRRQEAAMRQLLQKSNMPQKDLERYVFNMTANVIRDVIAKRRKSEMR